MMGVSSANVMSANLSSSVRGTPAGPERVQSTRKVSSTIINEQMMGPPPQDYPVREIEVPGPVQEVVTHVPRKEVIETEKRVPKYEYEYVDKIVEVPRIEYVDKVVEVPQYHEVIVERKVPQVVDVPREVIKEVKIPRINYVDKVVEVPGETIEVPRHYTVEQKVEFTRYRDTKKPVVVAQSVKPVIVEGAGVTEVDVYEYEPEVIPVDVQVVKGVQAQVQAGGVVETNHRVVSVPAAQYNTILRQLNTHLVQTETSKLPFLNDGSGRVNYLSERVVYADPQPGAQIQGLDMANMLNTHVDHASRKTLPVDPSRYPGVTSAMLAGINAGATTSMTTTGMTSGMYTSSPQQLGGYSTGGAAYGATSTSYLPEGGMARTTSYGTGTLAGGAVGAGMVGAGVYRSGNMTSSVTRTQGPTVYQQGPISTTTTAMTTNYL
ncbi:inner membrane complex protein [Gregarina niphandrodes]|uniref:Inner membrane complex protein n=1 Tax=Gregarina niphandrodes TaxID=110365 RepID=A0A023B717_GRENI|nr:inner membrane complex protein [Gregarina niphandrodes]EZG66949.1 inner membrane complex protein [Gregarina niphandrodes]|eukprot:XP_011130408.1 inner membrane complex protein [Gregarina niphandrodes]